MRVDWCVSSWFRIKNTHSLTHSRVSLSVKCGVFKNTHALQSAPSTHSLTSLTFGQVRRAAARMRNPQRAVTTYVARDPGVGRVAA